MDGSLGILEPYQGSHFKDNRWSIWMASKFNYKETIPLQVGKEIKGNRSNDQKPDVKITGVLGPSSDVHDSKAMMKTNGSEELAH